MKKILPDMQDMIESEIEFNSPNHVIEIHEGKYKLKIQKKEYESKGRISFEWFPFQHAVIKCEITSELEDKYSMLCEYKVLHDNQELGILEPHSGSIGEDVKLEGNIIGMKYGDSSITTKKIKFSVINLRDVPTTLNAIKRDGDLSGKFTKRLKLETTKFTINIDQRLEFNDHYDKLKRSGGFHVLWYGEIEAKAKHNLSYSDLDDIRNSLKSFLSFLGGTYSYPMLFKGIHDDKVVWEEYHGHELKPYNESYSWTIQLKEDQIGKLWTEYYKLYTDPEKRDLINKTISWYLEINQSVSNVESQIITAQANLELLYNWLIIDSKKLLKGNDASNITASNKIRLLLNEINLGTSLPSFLSSLTKLKDENQHLIDAPEIIVYIRNAIVHGQMEKHKFLVSLETKVFNEALSLLIWYTEISILYILKFKGIISNRFAETIDEMEYEIK